jgi:hypothetical protein
MGDIVNSVADVFGFGPASKQADATKAAASESAAAARYATDLQKAMFDKQIELQQPWQQAGVNALTKMQAGEFALPESFKYDPNSMYQDPGYAFRMEEGMNALNRSMAAKGLGVSGSNIKGALRYGQNLGSQEFGAAYGRAMDEYNSRLNRANTGYNRLAALSGVGQTATDKVGSAASSYGANVGNIAMGNAATQGNALMQRGNIAAQQYGTAGRALDQALNTDWSKIGKYFGGGSGDGGSTPGYGVYDGAVQGGPYGSA